jgi:hypothetical protein
MVDAELLFESVVGEAAVGDGHHPRIVHLHTHTHKQRRHGREGCESDNDTDTEDTVRV